MRKLEILSVNGMGPAEFRAKQQRNSDMKRKRPTTPSNPLRDPVVPSDDLETVIAKAREEATWFPEDGKTWRLLVRMADELEKHVPRRMTITMREPEPQEQTLIIPVITERNSDK